MGVEGAQDWIDVRDELYVGEVGDEIDAEDVQPQKTLITPEMPSREAYRVGGANFTMLSSECRTLAVFASETHFRDWAIRSNWLDTAYLQSFASMHNTAFKSTHEYTLR